jgi:hypothetical protein
MGLQARYRLTATIYCQSTDCQFPSGSRINTIHPFSHGNGLHARVIADVIAVKYGQPECSWDAGANLVAEGIARWMPTRMTSRHSLNLRDSKPDSDMSNIILNRVHDLIDMTGED